MLLRNSKILDRLEDGGEVGKHAETRFIAFAQQGVMLSLTVNVMFESSLIPVFRALTRRNETEVENDIDVETPPSSLSL